MDANKDPYKTLGIEPDASIEEIKCAYRKAAIRWHPDVSKVDPAESKRQFKLATDAYKYVFHKALSAAIEARKARQAQADSDEPIQCGPRPDCPRFTPPPPSPRQRRRQTRSGMSRKEESDGLMLILLTCLFVFGVFLLLITEFDSRETESRAYIEDGQAVDPMYPAALLTVIIGVILLIVLILSRFRAWRRFRKS